jgi:tRNA(Ile)-lysidine synthase
MSVLTERVCRTIDRFRLLPPGARVIAGVSGGADSTALVCLLRDIAPQLGVVLAGVAHFNHTLRGAASDADEQFCRTLAGRLDLAFYAGRGDVRAAARALGTSIEDAGRRLRYRYFDEVLVLAEATHVAVGHTRDDQAETLLLNLVRGAGPRGLGGMRPLRGRVARPLIECTHAELIGWLAERGIGFREDESNADPRHARNRLRHQVLPLIDAAFPGSRNALCRSAEIARADADFLDDLARQWLAGPGAGSADEEGLDAAGLTALPVALARRAVFLRLTDQGGGPGIGFEQVDRVLDLAAGRTSGRLILPGLEVAVSGGRLVFSGRTGRGPGRTEYFSPAGNFFRAALSIPGEALLPGGLVVSSVLRPGSPSASELRIGAAEAAGLVACVDAARCRELWVRFRQPGDRLRPLGAGGRRKLQDLFVDRKVPRAVRDRTPIVVDADDRIVWVAGHAVSEDFRVSDATRAVVILKLRGERV